MNSAFFKTLKIFWSISNIDPDSIVAPYYFLYISI